MAGQTALIVVDMLNTYEHEDAELLTESVAEAVGPMSDLLSRATEQNARIIYVNDNYGDWNSSQEELTQRALAGARPDLVEPVLPPRQVTELCILTARSTRTSSTSR